MVSAQEALELLKKGNSRYVSGMRFRSVLSMGRRRRRTRFDQSPFAVILGCSDSRVPPEIIFDKGLGDLFVVRVAGNVAGISQIGTIEIAVQRLGTRLVVVLGHTECGAIRAAIEEIEQPAEHLSPGWSSIVGAIRPLVETLPDSDRRPDNPESVESVVRANIRAVTTQLQQTSHVLGQFIRDEGLRVIGAEYSLETGIVDFFEGLENK